MDNSQIVGKLTEIFEDVFYEDDLAITREMSANDIDNWDSLTHVRLVMSIEKGFNIRFSAAETGKLKNVGDLIDLIASKL